MLLVTIGGLVIVASLIGIVSGAFDSKVEELRKGRSRVLEQDHTLILGWSSKVFPIVREIATANVGRDDNAPFGILAADLVRTHHDLDRSKFAQRQERYTVHGLARLRQRYGQTLDRGHVLPERFRESDDNIESAVAFEKLSGHGASKRRRDDTLDIIDAETVPRERVPVGDHGQDGQTGDLFGLQVLGAGNC